MSFYKPTIVLVGVNGAIGKHILNALLSPTFKSLYTLPIRAITRDAAKAQANLPSGATQNDIKFYTAKIATGEGFDVAFKGVDVVINVLGIGVSYNKVSDAALAAKTKVYIPSEFGTDTSLFGAYKPVFQTKIDSLEYAKSI